jgi:succinate dehydrogenase / fumarate reductase cytochrome b subunit
MSQSALRSPRAYRRGSWSNFVEGLRYGGGIGQWSWVLHRVTGLGVLLFLLIHVIDTFLVVAFPAEYDWTVAIYGGVVSGLYLWPIRWAFRFAELGLIASVVFHAVNGVRIVLFDFWPKSAAYQRQLFWGVLVIFFAIMVPVSIWVLSALAYAPAHVSV